MLQDLAAFLLLICGSVLLFGSTLVSIFIEPPHQTSPKLKFIIAQQLTSILMLIAGCYIQHW